MKPNRLLIPVAGAALVVSGAVAGCDSSTSSTAPQPPPASSASSRVPANAAEDRALLARPLRLPSVAPGGPCPVTPPRPAPAPLADTGWPLLGDGPAFPVGYYFRAGTTLLVGRAADGWYEQKVRWVTIDYQGPMLIRARRLDGRGEARVQFSYEGEAVGDAELVDVNSVPSDDFPAITRVQGAGCHAYQVDGDSFTTVIVFRAVLG